MTTQQAAGALAELARAGVSIWLDDISRERLVTGNLAELARAFGVCGVTSNPTIFEHAMTRGTAYDEQIADLALRGVGVDEAIRAMTTFDIRWACDVLRPAHEATGGVDGRVSIEVDPRLAADTPATIAEARALWWLVDRPNLLVKIPATPAGLPAITACLAEGLSINVTLIFSLRRYEEVIGAFMSGLEQAYAAGRDLARIASVASFFVSRVDTEVDRRLDALGTAQARALRGRAAVPNARLAYEIFEREFASPRWQALAARGARIQRPLWASTSTKDPSYPDTKYVTELVAAHTVNTMPEATLRATADHGVIAGDTITGGYEEARAVFAGLEAAGISYADVVAVLEEEGVRRFADSWADVRASVGARLRARSPAAAAAGR